jgi:hypothetical protein
MGRNKRWPERLKIITFSTTASRYK